MNTQNIYAVAMLNDEIAATSTTHGPTIDLANYVNVGKRELKFIVATNWGSTVAATAETVIVYLEGLDSSASAASTVTGTGIVGSTVTSGAGGEATTELNLLITNRYVRACAYNGAATTAFFGVAVVALPLRRFAQ
jgi:hypothetical protein